MRCLLSLLLSSVCTKAQSPSAAKARAMLQRMSLDEKISMLHGDKTSYTGGTPEILNATTGVRIPPLNLNDGPQGYRSGGTTCWPSALTVGATFDVALALKWGQAMGKEFFDKGANVQLGPGMCLARVPTNGRNFEYISGEDPYLGSMMVPPLVKGIQSQNVIANAKHFIMNNQETNRGGMTAAVDERTRFEMYYPPFEAASKAGVGSIMCSYNKIQTDGLNEFGDWSCENGVTLMRDFKERIGFKGWVMSDWGATHSTSILQGLDQEMPGPGTGMNTDLKAMVLDGDIPLAAVDDSVMRILTPMYEVGLFDHYDQWTNASRQQDDVTSKEHSAVARELAAAATVLLKNDGVLPLKQNVKTIAVIGQNGGQGVIVHGGGSGQVQPTYVVTPYEGLVAHYKPKTKNCTFRNDTDFMAYPSRNIPGVTSKEDCCGLCFENYPSCMMFTFTPPSGCWLHPLEGNFTSHEGYVSGACVDPSDDKMVNITYDDGTDLERAVGLARDSDVAIVFVGTSSHEGADRTNLSFPVDQDALVSAVAKVAKGKTVVVAFTPGAALMPWAEDVSAVLTMFMPGLEVGNALADVLTGTVNPTGRLPLTFPNKENEVNFTRLQYPGVNTISVYSEKLEVGYRYYQAHGIKPAFPFGHGLSYTSFKYHDLAFSTAENGMRAGITVSVNVTNTGSVPGADIPQLYLGFPASAGEPPRQLKGFAKTPILAPGATTTLQFTLEDRDLSIWDEERHAWSKQTGKIFHVFVGASSEDVRVTADLPIKGTR